MKKVFMVYTLNTITVTCIFDNLTEAMLYLGSLNENGLYYDLVALYGGD